MRPGGPAIVRRIDHVNVVVPDPPAFFRVLTERFELPVAWPFTRFPSFESGAAAIGINVEAVRYAPGHPSPAGDYAGLYAIAFEPEPLDEARAELARREIPHSPPLRYTGRYPAEANTPVLHRPPQEGGALWTLIVLGGLIGDESSARRYSRGIERGAGRFAPIIGRIGGWLASGPLAARVSAQGTSRRPFVFLCKYNDFNIPEGHAIGLADLASREGGPLGLVRTQELVVTAREAAAEVDRWQRLLDPLEPTEPGRWQPGDGPALRVVEGDEDRIDRMVWTVRSLDKAADWLRGQDMLAAGPEGTISIAPDVLQGVNISLEAEDEAKAD
jgi:hypothetical protein